VKGITVIRKRVRREIMRTRQKGTAQKRKGKKENHRKKKVLKKGNEGKKGRARKDG
jgi:hypothetical protein